MWPGGWQTYFHCAGQSKDRIDEADRAVFAKRADRLWLVGYSLMFLVPSLILFTMNLLLAGAVWFAAWLVYVGFVAHYFPRVQTM